MIVPAGSGVTSVGEDMKMAPPSAETLAMVWQLPTQLVC